jgi:4-hydroxy-tetrahydrodipicolinate synthase
MSSLQFGLVHTPVTPFGANGRIDFELFEKLLDFHLGNGAAALALPMHAGESVSLPEREKQAAVEFAIKHAKVPVIAHVSEAGTGLAVALARHAEKSGAAGIVATTPYYWTPPPAMVLEHFAQIGRAVKIPLFVHNAPDDMAGTRVTADLMLKLIGQLDNLAGLVDSSLDWQFMIELMTLARRARPDFQLLAGTELMVSAAAIGATGMFSSFAGVAPKRVRQLYDLCRADKLFEARPVQEEVAALRQLLKAGGIAGLKAAMRLMGRDCGHPRPPLLPLDGTGEKALASQLSGRLRGEPRGW